MTDPNRLTDEDAHVCEPWHKCAVCGNCSFVYETPYNNPASRYQPFQLPAPESGSLASDEFRILCELDYWLMIWLMFMFHGRKFPTPDWWSENTRLTFAMHKHVALNRILNTHRTWGN